MAIYILPYRYLIETEEEKMDVEYMSCYYEDMIEKIMKEALTEKYWEKMIKYHLDSRFYLCCYP